MPGRLSRGARRTPPDATGERKKEKGEPCGTQPSHARLASRVALTIHERIAVFSPELTHLLLPHPVSQAAAAAPPPPQPRRRRHAFLARMISPPTAPPPPPALPCAEPHAFALRPLCSRWATRRLTERSHSGREHRKGRAHRKGKAHHRQ
eukprot:5122941-Prymnesium_polylepis.1